MKRTTRYWICQIIGWGGWLLLQVFVAYQFAPETILTPEIKRNLFFFALFVDFFCFIAVTHGLRFVLKKLQWLSFSPEKIFITFITGILITAVLSFYGSQLLLELPGNTFEKFEINESARRSPG